jgi:Ca2+-binding RTX toxin-like protein
MTTVDAGGQTFDMTAIDLSDFGGGTVTASSATEIDVTGEGGTLFYKIIGTGLGDFDVNGFPHSGTITGFDLGPSHGVPSSFTGLSMSASTFMGFVSDDDLTGFETAALSGADHLTGYRGNDVLIGGGGNDIFGLSKGGDDTVSGGAGNDYFSFGAAFTGADTVDGGDGSDKIALNGDYSAGVTLGTSTLTSVESIVVSAGHSYSLTTVDANVASGAILSVNASLLGAGNTLTFDGSAETDGVFHLTGGAGNDVLTGGAGADSFILNKGGNDTVNGGGGNDYISFDTAFTAADTVNGGAGSDRIVLAGNYASGVTLGATTLNSVETVVVDDGHSYKLIFNDGNVAAGQTMSVNGTLLTGTHTLYADGSAETDGLFHLSGGAGNDTLIGGSGADTFVGNDGNDTLDLSRGGADNANGGAGDDLILVGANLTSSDKINGGDGNDTMLLDGNYSTQTLISWTQAQYVETIAFAAGHNYNIDVNFGSEFIDDRTQPTIDASALGAGNSLTFQSEGLFGFDIIGGAGNDVIHADNRVDSRLATIAIVDMSHGGNDTVYADNTDAGVTIDFGGTLNSSDMVFGNANSTVINLDGDYSAGLTLDSSYLSHVATFLLQSGFDYDLTVDPTMGALTISAIGNTGGTVTIDDSSANHTLLFEASGNQVIDVTGGNFADNYIVSSTGVTGTITGGSGNDSFGWTGLSSGDVIDGGAGNDTLGIDDTNATINVTATMVQNVETLFVNLGDTVTLADGVIASGHQMAITVGTGAHIDDSAETNGTIDVSLNVPNSGGTTGGESAIAGAGNDILTDAGSASLTVSMTGGGGADMITCGATVDTLVYNGASDSTGSGFDTVIAFDAGHDFFDMPGSVTGVDATVASGTLTTAAFDTNMAAAIGASQLAAHHAVLFTPTSGDYTGDTFLIVDVNGTAGYQAGADIVIEMQSATGTLTTANFI